MKERLGKIFLYVLNILSKPWWRKPTTLREWLILGVNTCRKYTWLGAASLYLQHPVSLQAMGSGYLLIYQLPYAFGSHKISSGGRISAIFGLISAFCNMRSPVTLLVSPAWAVCSSSRSTWRRGRPSCGRSHSSAFCFHYISSLHGQMLGRVEPATCILMCFFSDHSSFALDMPQPLVPLGTAVIAMWATSCWLTKNSCRKLHWVQWIFSRCQWQSNVDGYFCRAPSTPEDISKCSVITMINVTFKGWLPATWKYSMSILSINRKSKAPYLQV